MRRNVSAATLEPGATAALRGEAEGRRQRILDGGSLKDIGPDAPRPTARPQDVNQFVRCAGLVHSGVRAMEGCLGLHPVGGR